MATFKVKSSNWHGLENLLNQAAELGYLPVHFHSGGDSVRVIFKNDSAASKPQEKTITPQERQAQYKRVYTPQNGGVTRQQINEFYRTKGDKEVPFPVMQKYMADNFGIHSLKKEEVSKMTQEEFKKAMTFIRDYDSSSQEPVGSLASDDKEPPPLDDDIPF